MKVCSLVCKYSAGSKERQVRLFEEILIEQA